MSCIMSNSEVVSSLYDYSREFIRTYQNQKLNQKVIDAIVVDFINYYAGMHCGMDLAMDTFDLRNGKKMSLKGTVLDKEIILPTLNFHKDEYNKDGIIESVNRNEHMNECEGNAKADNRDALDVVNKFISGYYNY